MRPAQVLLYAAVLASCQGSFSPWGGGEKPAETKPRESPTAPESPESPKGQELPSEPLRYGASPGLRPLSVRELNASLKVLLGDDRRPASVALPSDVPPSVNVPRYPFDNSFYAAREPGSYDAARVSAPRITAIDELAKDVTEAFLKDDARMQAVLPCIPASITDQDCFTKIVRDFGLASQRRPLSEEDVDAFVSTITTFAAKANNARGGLNVFFRAMLESPDFLYRTELGKPVEGRAGEFMLDDYELASKLSFTLTGRAPSLALLKSVAAGKLQDEASLASVVDQLLASPEAVEHLEYFHAAWLGYQQVGAGTSSLSKAMRAEARAHVERVVFAEKRPWRDLFTLNETFVTTELAAYYKLSAPAGAQGWVRHTDQLRHGLFGTSAFLAVGGRADGDTSATFRGKNVRQHLFCEPMPPPPPNVNPDDPPKDPNASPCKIAQLKATVLTMSACAGCHRNMDPIAFGLENYSAFGLYRAAEETRPECTITGEGTVAGHGTFKGPAGLAKLALDSGRLELCLVQRWLEFSNGNTSDTQLGKLAVALADDFRTDGNLILFLRRLALSDEFRVRRSLPQELP
jgi:hypothetical protein